MKIEATKYEYVKTKIDNFEIELIEEPFAYQKYNHRVMVLVVPKWTTWNKEQTGEDEFIYEYKIIQVSRDISKYVIENKSIQLNRKSIESRLTSMSNKKCYDLEDEVLDNLMRPNNMDRISVDLFQSHFNTAVSELNQLIEI